MPALLKALEPLQHPLEKQTERTGATAIEFTCKYR